MGKIWMPGGGGGTDLDVVTADAGDVLKGKVIVGPDGEPLTGTLELTGTAADSQVLNGQTYYNTDAKAKRTGAMANQGAKTASLDCGGSYTIPAGYHNGSGKVTANSLASQTSANAAAGDIRKNKTAWVGGSKVTGSLEEKAAETYTPGTSNKTISANQILTGAQTIKGDANLVAANILSGKSIFGVSGNVKAFKRIQLTLTSTSAKTNFKSSNGDSHNWYSISYGALSLSTVELFAIKAASGKTNVGHSASVVPDPAIPGFNHVCLSYQAWNQFQGPFDYIEINGGNGAYINTSGFVLPVPYSSASFIITIIGT